MSTNDRTDDYFYDRLNAFFFGFLLGIRVIVYIKIGLIIVGHNFMCCFTL